MQGLSSLEASSWTLQPSDTKRHLLWNSKGQEHPCPKTSVTRSIKSGLSIYAYVACGRLPARGHNPPHRKFEDLKLYTETHKLTSRFLIFRLFALGTRLFKRLRGAEACQLQRQRLV